NAFAAAATATATLTINGGSASIGGNIVNASTRATTVSTLNLLGGTLDMNGNSIGGNGGVNSGNGPIPVNFPNTSVSSTLNNSGRLDIGDNKLIVPTPDSVGSATGGVYNGITGLIQSGRGGGGGVAPFWDGAGGIVTSQANATGSNFTSIGIATAQQVKNLAN